MFPLHESTQRKLCRILFGAICIAPTFALAGYGLRLNLPGHRQATESALAGELGLRVLVDSVVHPRPGETRLHNVRLRDPETGAQIGQIRELEITQLDGRTVIYAAQPQLDAAHFELIFRRFEERALRSGASPAGNFELHAADLTITAPQAESQTLRNVLLRVARGQDTTTAELHYLVAGVAMAEPATVRITRSAPAKSPAGMSLAWHTGGAALPVAPWVARFPWLAHLGEHCHFRGELSAEQTGRTWRGELGGELSRIDLEQLVSDQFSHKLSGEARAIFESLRFEEGRVASVRGRIEAGPGVIGQPLLTAAIEQLTLQHSGESASSAKSNALRRYTKLALHFALDDHKLALRGECGGATEGTALVIGEERYATEPESSLSPLALVRTLSPASDHQVPATQATRSLVQVLPLPKETLQAEAMARGHVRGAQE
jgi:hypothetical protein